jgi:hypothetical protein
LANRYGQKLDDIKKWLSKTIWGQHQLSEETLLNVQEKLLSLNLIEEIKQPNTFLHPNH